MKAPSVPERMRAYWFANAAVLLKRGSTTITCARFTSFAVKMCCMAMGCEVQTFSPMIMMLRLWRMSFIELVIAP